jgi:hypothetical protein
VPLADWLYFAVVTTRSLCARQDVSAPCSVPLFHCPDDSLALRSKESECPSLAAFISLS